MKSAAPLAEQVRDGRRLLGGLLRMPNLALVELFGLAGLGFVVIDGEHGSLDGESLHHHLTAAKSVGLGTIVRIGADHDVLRALDQGADGLLLPHVTDADRARQLVGLASYPPAGSRGFASYTRAADYGLRTSVEHLQSGPPLLIAMIEDEDGLAAASDIAAVPGIDALMLGPADFVVSSGSLEAADLIVPSTRARIRAAAHSEHKADLAIVSTAEAAAGQWAEGASLVMYNMQAAVTGLVKDLAEVAAAASVSANTPMPEVVVLSGMLGSADAWADVALACDGSVEFQHIRTDLADSVEELAAAVLASAPRQFVLAGHSLGGIVAMEVARRAPDRLLGLAVFNTSGRRGTPEQRDHWSTLVARIDDGDFDGVADDLSEATSISQFPDVTRRSRAMAAHVGRDGLQRQLSAQLQRPEALDHLRSLQMPMLVVSGELDTVSPVNLQLELSDAVPGSEHQVIAGTGHMSLLERPVAVAEVLVEWLTSRVMSS